jgi:hypothetical protein
VRIAVVLAVGISLAGCVSAQERQAQADAQAAAINAHDDAQCQSYGAAPGSPSYIQCRMNLDNQRAQRRQIVAGALVNNMLNH